MVSDARNSSPPGEDEIYQWLIEAHAGLSDEESLRLNFRLVLILANRLGDPELIREAIAAASAAGQRKKSQHPPP